MAKNKNGDGDGYGDDEGDTGGGKVTPDNSPIEPDAAGGGVVAGRDDIPVDPGNSGAAGDNVYSERSDGGSADPGDADSPRE